MKAKNDPEIARQESNAARRERGYLDSEKAAADTGEVTAHEMPERDDGHIQVVHKNCQRLSCPICEGGLFQCSRCNSAEGATTSECPGEKMTWAQVDAVYAGKLDFRGGKWVNECSPHAPAALRRWPISRGDR